MNCQAQRGSLIELARGRLFDVHERKRAAAHWSVCPECRLFMEEQIALTSATAALAEETSGLASPADLESILLREFLSTRASRKPIVTRILTVGAIAAALLAFALVLNLQRAQRSPAAPAPVTRMQQNREIPPAARPPAPLLRVRHRAAPQVDSDAPVFIAIPYTAPLDPRERATVMRINMPVAALTAVGLATATPDAGASAQADVIVGEDGRIRAIRVLSITDSIPERSIIQ